MDNRAIEYDTVSSMDSAFVELEERLEMAPLYMSVAKDDCCLCSDCCNGGDDD